MTNHAELIPSAKRDTNINSRRQVKSENAKNRLSKLDNSTLDFFPNLCKRDVALVGGGLLFGDGARFEQAVEEVCAFAAARGELRVGLFV